MSDRFENEKYVNWLKVSLALIYAKEGLEQFTDTEVQNFHRHVSNMVPSGSSLTSYQTCSSCLRNNLRKQWHRKTFKCAANICDRWIGAILSHHVSPRPQVEWDNADISQLPISAWECAKLFMSFGCQSNFSVQDFDFASLLTLYINCLHFHGFIQHLFLCEQVREIRNKTMHSGRMEVETSQMQMDVATVVHFLQDPKHFNADPRCQEAVRKIQELMDGTLELSLNKELELRIINSTIQDVNDKVSDLYHQHERLSSEILTLTADISTLRAEHADNLKMKSEMEKVKRDIEEVKNTVQKFSAFLQAAKIQKADLTRLSRSQCSLHTLSLCIDRCEQTLLMHEQALQRHEAELSEQRSSIENLRRQQECQATEQKTFKRTLDCLDKKTKQSRTSDVELTEEELLKLRQYLIEYYEEICLWFQNPVIPEMEVRLAEIYVDPEIQVLRERQKRSGLVEVPSNQMSELSYKQVFHTDAYKCKQIYVTGGAGAGKSMFSKSVVATWCKAHGIEDDGDDESELEDDKHITKSKSVTVRTQHLQEERRELKEENLRIMREFDLMFYITLRDAMSEYSVTEMIYSQILQHNSSLRYLDTEVILRNEKCLIILDGLDEWVSPKNKTIAHFANPGIPGHDRLNKNNVVVTTTRPWKFDVLRLKTSELDKHIELFGLSETSAQHLTHKIVKMLNKTQGCNMNAGEFWNVLNRKGLGHFKTVPVILIQLICLWFDKKGISDSQVQLYGSMLDLLLERAEKHLSSESDISSKNSQTDYDLPACFKDNENCLAYKHLLLCLSKLAFESLFSEDKEFSLVFPSTTVEMFGISSAEIDVCLKCGILSQNKVLGVSSKRLKKLSFLHKKLQEFLAALYVVISVEDKGVFTKIKRICATVDDCLDMSKVFMFVAGMNSHLGKQLLAHFSCKIEEDERVLKYRKTLTPEDTTPLIQNIQGCFIECVTETLTNGHSYEALSPQFVDFVLTKNTICDDLEILIRNNKFVAKSMYINTKDIVGDNRQVLETTMSHLGCVSTLEKLHLSDVDSIVSVDHILNTVNNCRNSIRCLVLWQVKLNKMVGHFHPVCCALTGLQSIRLEYVTLTHEQIIGLMLFVSKHDLKDLRLWWLQCADHPWGDCTPSLDLACLSHLQTLQLSHMAVDNVHVISGSSKTVILSLVSMPALTWRTFIRDLPRSQRRLEVELRWVEFIGSDNEYVDMREEMEHNEILNVSQSKFDGEKCYITFSHM